MAHARPNPWQWMWYAYGGGLPQRLREWVLHDLTCRTWVLRHLARTLAQWAPTLLLMLLPGPSPLRLSLPVLVIPASLYASPPYIDVTSHHRLPTHGVPSGIATQLPQATVRSGAIRRPVCPIWPQCGGQPRLVTSPAGTRTGFCSTLA